MRKVINSALALLLLVTTAQAQVDTRKDTVIAAKVPYTAYGPQFDYQKGYFVSEIKKGTGVYWITEGTSQVMFMTTGKGVIVVDAPPSFGDKITKAIAEVTQEPIKYLIYSHAHADHISGAYQFPKNIQVISSEAINAKLKDLESMKRDAPFGIMAGGKPVPLPTRTFKDSLTLTVGNKTLKLYSLEASHTHGDVIVYLPKEKILMAVDLVWPGWVPFDGFGEAEDLPGYVDAQSRLLKFDWDTMVCGHMGRLGTRQDVETNIAYINDVKYAVEKAIQNANYMAAAKKTGFSNSYLTLETFFDTTAHAAAKEVEQKWLDKLAGADIYTYSDCRRMMFYLMLN